MRSFPNVAARNVPKNKPRGIIHSGTDQDELISSENDIKRKLSRCLLFMEENLANDQELDSEVMPCKVLPFPFV